MLLCCSLVSFFFERAVFLGLRCFWLWVVVYYYSDDNYYYYYCSYYYYNCLSNCSNSNSSSSESGIWLTPSLSSQSSSFSYFTISLLHLSNYPLILILPSYPGAPPSVSCLILFSLNPSCSTAKLSYVNSGVRYSLSKAIHNSIAYY